MVTFNIDVEDGLVNGACGMLQFMTKHPTIAWINFNSASVGNKARLCYKSFMENNNIPNFLTPICAVSSVLNISYKLKYQVTRTQFPLVPAEAITVHKSQGQTYQQVCIDLEKSKRMTRQMLYVAISRVSSLKGLYIIGQFKPSLVRDERSDPTLIELQKLKLEKALKLQFNLLVDNTFNIVYQNINSLTSKFRYILSDSWYKKSDVLIFTETLTNSNDLFDFPEFKVIFRSNATSSSRGILCIVNSKLNVSNIQHVYEGFKNSHIELFSFSILEYVVISGYKSPKCSYESFQKNIKLMFSKLDTVDNVVLLGDFNLDIYKTSYVPLHSFLNTFNLKTALNCNCTTTNYNTQIDVIFTNIKNVSAGTYESCFSYHKPIFLSISNTNVISDVNTKNEKEVMGIKDCSIQKDILPQIAEKFDSNDRNDPFSIDNSICDINIILDYKNGYLNDEHIDSFHQIVRSKTIYRPQGTYLVCMMNRIKPVNHSNIQILFIRPVVGSIGHWICSYFDSTNVHIYDSLNSSTLHEDARQFIEKLYPNLKIPPILHKVQQQTNHIDCGVFAIAYATSICTGGNPVGEIYKINEMRKHAARILTDRSLIPFPKETLLIQQ